MINDILENLSRYLSIAVRQLELAWFIFLDKLRAVMRSISDVFDDWLIDYPAVARFLESGSPTISLFIFALIVVTLLFLNSLQAKQKLDKAAAGYEFRFDDISPEAAQELKRVLEPHSVSESLSELANKNASSEKSTSVITLRDRPNEAQKFKIFKKPKKKSDTLENRKSIEDDQFLLGIEQEMLATRQLFLDGLISKDVYVAETRSLFVTAQKRMT